MPAYEIPGQRIALKGATAITADGRYVGVVVNSDGKFALPAAGAVIAGVAQRESVLDEANSIMINGVTFGLLGGTVAAGAEVEVTDTGAFVAKTTGAAVGICLTGGSSGELGSILLK
jgi:hypothetical protein